MDARDSGNLGRIANAVEKIAHTLEKPKNTSEFRIAALKRQTKVADFITKEMDSLSTVGSRSLFSEPGEWREYCYNILGEIKRMLIGN